MNEFVSFLVSPTHISCTCLLQRMQRRMSKITSLLHTKQYQCSSRSVISSNGLSAYRIRTSSSFPLSLSLDCRVCFRTFAFCFIFVLIFLLVLVWFKVSCGTYGFSGVSVNILVFPGCLPRRVVFRCNALWKGLIILGVITLRVDVDGIGEVLDVDGVACVGIGNEGTGEEVVIGVFVETDGDSGDKGLEVSSLSVTAEHKKSSTTNISELKGCIPEFLKPLTMLAWLKDDDIISDTNIGIL
jgi:hypothetical protein